MQKMISKSLTLYVVWKIKESLEKKLVSFCSLQRNPSVSLDVSFCPRFDRCSLLGGFLTVVFWFFFSAKFLCVVSAFE